MDTKLVELRKRAIQKGMELLSEDEILREVKRRRKRILAGPARIA